MLWTRLALAALLECLIAHLRHQPLQKIATDNNTFPAQIGSDLARAEERVFGKHAIDLFYLRQRLGIDPDRHVVERESAEPRQLALLADAQLGMITLDHGV